MKQSARRTQRDRIGKTSVVPILVLKPNNPMQGHHEDTNRWTVRSCDSKFTDCWRINPTLTINGSQASPGWAGIKMKRSTLD